MLDDVNIATKYLAKYRNALESCNEFDLSFQSYRNMMRAKKCYYTGITLTETGVNNNGVLRPNDRTIDRIDNSLGYVKGNVVACSHAANQFKSTFEAGHSVFEIKHIKRMMKRL